MKTLTLCFLVYLLVLSVSSPVYGQLRNSEDRLIIQSIILQEAVAVGVDPGLAIFLAAIESDFSVTAKNPNSSATGLYQFISQTWKDYCWGEITNARDNTRCAMRLIANGGISHWTADKNTERLLRKNGFIK